ncbi:YqaA family protein [Mangrovicoccus algicola]|uniref:DedA family protein n=1 Tax=Mangrovicoccus algicola TaxID=2771008 RepID=A0A8J6YVI6_9RHOB|nr:hypothetical protein [Mangrovicoccus algicola]MBE3638407.1 hypothetical protein [Mangrovicoccus algicola]
MAEGRSGIAVLSAMEATFLPIPLEAVLVPLMIARPAHALMLGLWSLIGCLAGTAILYLSGWLLADPVVLPLLDWLGLSAQFAALEGRLHGTRLFFTVLLLSVSPFPIQLASLGAGMLGSSFALLMVAVTVARGGRYMGLGVLAHLLGPRLAALHVPRWVWITALAGLLALSGHAFLF